MFWGHSVGPGGLFEDDNSGEKRSDGRLNLPLHEVGNAVFHAREVLKKRNTRLGMAIFKNCAMATVETACEFQGKVPYSDRVAGPRARRRMAVEAAPRGLARA